MGQNDDKKNEEGKKTQLLPLATGLVHRVQGEKDEEQWASMLSTFVCFEDLVTNAGVGMVCYLGDVVFVFDASCRKLHYCMQ